MNYFHLLRNLSGCVLASVITQITSHSYATVFLDEPFNYSDGQLTGLGGGANVSGGNWTTLSGTGNPLQVLSGSITGLSHGAGSREDVTRVFSNPNISTGDVFAAFTIDVTTAPTGSTGEFFAALHSNSNSTFRGRVFIYPPSIADAGKFRLGLENDGASTSILSSDLDINQTYSVLLRLQMSDNTSALWINTDFSQMEASSPTLLDTTAPVLQSVGRFTLRQDNLSASNALNFDNLRITDTFGEAIPEPATFWMGCCGAASLLFMRRRSTDKR
jgi:hypothetical protein